VKASFLFIFGQFVILFIYAIIIIGCGEDIEDQNTIPLLDSSWFTALDMPTADGDSWEYIRSDGKYQYTSKIVGTTNVGGTTARILVSNSDIPADYLGASYGFLLGTTCLQKIQGNTKNMPMSYG